MNARERELAAAAFALGADRVAGRSAAERNLLRNLPAIPIDAVRELREAIRDGGDPLGDAFCQIRSPRERRPQGATYTPDVIVQAMLDGAGKRQPPARVIDPGTGSARFLVAAGRRFRKAKLLGVEIDPLAAVLARGHLAAAGLARRAQVVVGDYRSAQFDKQPRGATLFIGNPPYVRHHQIEPRWKQWLSRTAARYDLPVSQLAGLHVHFFLATLEHARPGDFGAFVTASEWLDVNYGALVRRLLLDHLGGEKLVVVEPEALPFADAATTAAIAHFTVGRRPTSISFHRVDRLDKLKKLNGGRRIRRQRLETESRWSHLTHASRKPPAGYVELGEICRVHRGQVTGANRIWIAGSHSEGLPDSVLFPAVTRAKELFAVDRVLDDDAQLRRVIDIPIDRDELTARDRAKVERFLKTARSLGAQESYIARNRKAWWSVGLKEPAPILATYMARRPPTFVRNLARVRHINIAHGLYPREQFSSAQLDRLAGYLSNSATKQNGRTYAGGLTKFEPREMERLLVPGQL